MTAWQAPPSPETARELGRVSFLGVDFDRFDPGHVLDDLREHAYANSFSYVVTPNVDHLVKINSDADTELSRRMSQACRDATLCICDSRILAHLARLSGETLDLLPGSDLTRDLVLHGLRPGDSVALIGGNPKQLEWFRRNWPHVDACQFIPRMGVLEDEQAQLEIASFVETKPCNYYLFAFGAPQSELVAALIRRRQRARGIALCIGASIDFLSGQKKRAPRWLQKLSLEWAFRLLTEPQRLWRRYLLRGPRIFAVWWKQRSVGRA